MAKHVIFLGAGASQTSGYPLAAGLKTILSSRLAFEHYLHEKLGPADSPLKSSLAKRFADMSVPVQLFREGGYGTIDEFSFLAQKQFPEEVNQFKQLVGLVLGLNNPEKSYLLQKEMTTGFASSDYYPFIQRLFRETAELRNDVAILSYNYDPYLEFLIDRAYNRRQRATGKTSVAQPLTQLTSGFVDRDADGILNGTGFCILKLHGMSVLPPQPPHTDGKELGWLTWNEAFSSQGEWQAKDAAWLKKLNCSPGMYFPWELFDDKGEFTATAEFSRFEELATGNLFYHQTGRSLHALCKAIWLRARKEIVDAQKFSFVGLSMHNFLKQGLKFLFSERVQKLESAQERLGRKDFDYVSEVVLACPGAWIPGENYATPARSNSPAAKLSETLAEINPRMAAPERPGQIHTASTRKKAAGGIVCYETFREFIESEL